MSWNIDIVGTPHNVRAAVEKEQHVPQVLKDAVGYFARSAQQGGRPPGAIRVSSVGHVDDSSGWSSVGTFSITPLTLADPGPVPQPAK